MPAGPAHPTIDVAAGVLARADGTVLVAQRLPGKHMAGSWEFPGGKIHDGETPLEGLTRELHEELGVQVLHAQPLVRLTHAYPDRTVRLQVWRVLDWRGEPQGAEGQALQWLPPEKLMQAGLLPADEPVVAALLADG